jgi:PAS domain S-box-containing protein
MADHAPMMVWVTEADGACSFLSRSYYQFTGQQPRRALGRGLLESVHPQDREAVRHHFQLESGGVAESRLEYRLRDRDGRYRWVLDAAAPRFDGQGRFLGAIGSVVDITDRKAAEDAVRAADRRKEEFLATLAHDLRNPLAPLRHGLELLRRGPADPGLLEDVRALMERQLRQITHVIDDLLDRAPAGEAPEAAPAEAEAASVPAREPARKHRVLVTDDNVDAAESLARLLALMGHEVLTAHGGAAALDLASAFEPTLVLLDIGMPGLDGYETCARLRQQLGRDVVIVALTGWGRAEARARSKEAGFDDHLVKPLDPVELERLLAASFRS